MNKCVLYKTEHHSYVLHYCGGSFPTPHAFSHYMLFPPQADSSFFLSCPRELAFHAAFLSYHYTLRSQGRDASKWLFFSSTKWPF